MKRIVILAIALLVELPNILYAGLPVAPVPKTGQTSCYDNEGVVISCDGTGQDGDYQSGVPLPNPRFTDRNNGTVTDNLTGLIWLKDTNCFNVQTWAGAIQNANTLADGVCGLSDRSTPGQWRLPTVKELESLIDLQSANPVLPSGHPFDNVQSAEYWASTSDVSKVQFEFSAWYINMSAGNVDYNDKGSFYYVWPVRTGNVSCAPAPVAKTGQTEIYLPGDDGDIQAGVIWPNNRFTDNGNGTITDNLTDLIWMKNANCLEASGGIDKLSGFKLGALSWMNALTWSNSISAGICGITDNSNAGDWRLPNRKELLSLVNFAAWSPGLPEGHPFTNVVPDYYWSSSTCAYNSVDCGVWFVNFFNNYVSAYTRDKEIFVWAVRSGLSETPGTVKFNLFVSPIGDGLGTVTSDPTGINCTSATTAECSFDFIENSKIKLFVTPAWNSVFGGWGLACSGTEECCVSMNDNKSVSASFNPKLTIKLVDDTVTFHSSLQEAYDKVVSNTVKLQAQQSTFYESPVFNMPFTVTLEGGLDALFEQTVGSSIINLVTGPLIIKNGKLIFKNIIIR